MRKVLGVRLVHLGEVGHVGQEDVDLDHACDIRARLLENSLDALAARLRLLGNATGDKGAGLVGGDAARDVDVGARDDGVGLSLYISTSFHLVFSTWSESNSLAKDAEGNVTIPIGCGSAMLRARRSC